MRKCLPFRLNSSTDDVANTKIYFENYRTDSSIYSLGHTAGFNVSGVLFLTTPRAAMASGTLPLTRANTAPMAVIPNYPCVGADACQYCYLTLLQNIF